jgi:hypothetical protein
LGKECSATGEKTKAYNLLMVKPEGNGPVGRPRLRWVNIMLDLGEIE